VPVLARAPSFRVSPRDGRMKVKNSIRKGAKGGNKNASGEKAAQAVSKNAKDVAEVNADWLGEADQDEDILGGEADSNEDMASECGEDGNENSDAEDGEEEDQEAPESDVDVLALRDEDVDDDGGNRHRSKMLARVVAGEQPADLAAIKQRISDAATLLGSWRSAQKMGETRSRDEVLHALVGDCSTYYGYAEELAEYFLKMFPAEQAIQFFDANEKSRPLTIRTNSLKARRSSLIQSLTARKVQVDPVGAWTKVGIKVYESAVPVGATPEYLGGHYMIQSASSLVPVMALAPQENETVLDMAAAPGGKTTYLGQLMKNTGALFANDAKKERCKALAANIHRMGLTNTIVMNMDGRKLPEHLPKLDRVLLDAPCSGSGIIARDPSVKVKRGTKDFEETSRLQKELLKAAVDMVNADSKTGGYIVYSTCSISVEENEAVIDYILKARNVELVSFSSSVNFGVEGLTRFRERRFHPSMNLCRRYYPHVHNMDGFFVAKLKKISNQVPERSRKDRSKGDATVWGEEHWTADMMETVVDYDEETGERKDPKTLNKRERKKLKREAQLAARAQTADGKSASAEAVAPGQSKPVASKAISPQVEAKTSESAAEGTAPVKKKLLKKRKSGAVVVKKTAESGPAADVSATDRVETPATDAAQASPATSPVKKKALKKKRKEAATTKEVEKAPPAASNPASESANAGEKKKKKVLKKKKASSKVEA